MQLSNLIKGRLTLPRTDWQDQTIQHFHYQSEPSSQFVDSTTMQDTEMVLAQPISGLRKKSID